jgi:hypothetical protein
MSEPSYLDKMKDNLHKKINKVNKKLKFSNSDHQDKLKQQNLMKCEQDLKRKQKKAKLSKITNDSSKKDIGLFFLKTLGAKLLYYFSLLLVAVNILFLVKGQRSIIDDLLNKIFPTNCREPPFGTPETSPCSSGLSEKVVEAIISKLGSGKPGKGNHSKTEPHNKSRHRGGGPTEPKASFPYSLYQKPTYDISIWHDWLNWFISPYALKSISVNSIFKDVFESETLRSDEMPDIAVIFLGICMIHILPIFIFYILFSLGFNRFKKTLAIKDYSTIIPILFSSLFVFVTDLFVSVFDIIYIYFQIFIQPIYYSWRNILLLLINQRSLILFITATALTQSFWASPFDSTFQDVATIIYTIFVITLVYFTYNSKKKA